MNQNGQTEKNQNGIEDKYKDWYKFKCGNFLLCLESGEVYSPKFQIIRNNREMFDNCCNLREIDDLEYIIKKIKTWTRHVVVKEEINKLGW